MVACGCETRSKRMSRTLEKHLGVCVIYYLGQGK